MQSVEKLNSVENLKKVAEAATHSTSPLPDEEPGTASFYNSELLASQYLSERKRQAREFRAQPGAKRMLLGASALYLLRRMVWSFGFFPVVIAFWLPLVFARFNPVVMVDSMLPALQGFVLGNPEAQAATIETVLIAWFSIGFAFTVFDLILTPFRSPLEQSVDAHMRIWLKLHAQDPGYGEKSAMRDGGSDERSDGPVPGAADQAPDKKHDEAANCERSSRPTHQSHI